MKLINTHQAADILGVKYPTVRRIVRKGYLKDYHRKNPNQKKHYMKVSVTDVREFKKNYEIVGGDILAKLHTSNGNNQTVETVEIEPTPKKNTQTPMTSFNDRLKSIESKLDTLIKLWS